MNFIKSLLTPKSIAIILGFIFSIMTSYGIGQSKGFEDEVTKLAIQKLATPVPTPETVITVPASKEDTQVIINPEKPAQ